MQSIEIDTDGLSLCICVSLYICNFLVNVSQRQNLREKYHPHVRTQLMQLLADLICTILSYISDDDEWFTHFYVLLLLL
jgi:hypothetical protein